MIIYNSGIDRKDNIIPTIPMKDLILKIGETQIREIQMMQIILKYLINIKKELIN